MKFKVVEQVAMASDTQLMRIGMGGEGLRIRAKNYLKGKNVSASSSEVDALKNELAEMRRLLMERPQAPPKNPKGWPKGKPRKPVNVVHNDAAIGAAGHE